MITIGMLKIVLAGLCFALAAIMLTVWVGSASRRRRAACAGATDRRSATASNAHGKAGAYAVRPALHPALHPAIQRPVAQHRTKPHAA